MLLGENTQTAQDTSVMPSAEIIFDADVSNFEQKVMHASMERPVIVDFWAPWCGPCLQLMPTLEKVVNEAGGEVLLAKVDLDENQELAAALRVQSVPMVFAFMNGQPVDAFQGAQPESQIKAFVDKLVQAARQNRPDAIDIPETLTAASAAMAQGDLPQAQGLYATILEQDENNVQAYVGLVRTFIEGGTPEHAQEMIENAPEAIAKDPKFAEAKTALDLAMKQPAADFSELEKKLADNPDDHQAHLDLAESQFAAGHKEIAVETLLNSIAKDRSWNDEAARKMLLTFFQGMGHADPITIQGRKKLSSLLFS